MIDAVIEGSLASGEVRMDDDVLDDMNELRDFMFERVYLAPAQRRPQAAAIDVIRRLMDHHLAHPEDIPASYRDNDADRVTQATDYIAGMTDRFALRTHERLFGDDGMDDADAMSHRAASSATSCRASASASTWTACWPTSTPAG